MSIKMSVQLDRPFLLSSGEWPEGTVTSWRGTLCSDGVKFFRLSLVASKGRWRSSWLLGGRTEDTVDGFEFNRGAR